MIDGVWCDDPYIIKNKVFNFYKDIYKEITVERPLMVNNQLILDTIWKLR